MRVLVTGATGFIGRVLVAELLKQNFDVSIAVRQKTNLFSDEVKQFIVMDFGNNPDFTASLAEVDCVIHLAGRAHIIDKTKASELNGFLNINRDLTLCLAKQAIDSDVKRFLFLSSIGVNGNKNNKPFLETDAPNPQESYAISKYEAEQGLMQLSQDTDLEVVIVRPPLVYGANAPGNFGRLIQWANAKFILPLPLGSVKNARSLIAIDNLVDFIIACSVHPKATNEIFLISDDGTLSTTKLLKKIAKAFDRKPLLPTIPVSWMIFMAKLIGREADAIRLFSSLVVDNSKARDLLDWKPVVTMDEAFKKIANK